MPVPALSFPSRKRQRRARESVADAGRLFFSTPSPLETGPRKTQPTGGDETVDRLDRVSPTGSCGPPPGDFPEFALESTGPYQKAAVGALLAEGLPAVVNARQVRDFAKAMNYLAKTDTLDAAVIATSAKSPPPRCVPWHPRKSATSARWTTAAGSSCACWPWRRTNGTPRPWLRPGPSPAEHRAAQRLPRRPDPGPGRTQGPDQQNAAFRARRDPADDHGHRAAGLPHPAGLPAGVGAAQPSGHRGAGRVGPLQRRQRHAPGAAAHPRRAPQGPYGPVAGGDRRHPALPAQEGD